MEVVVGSYEGFVLGYRVLCKPAASDDEEPKWKLKVDFAEKFHSSTVKCLGASGSPSESGASKSTLVASGSVDETVAVFNVTRRKSIGVLQEHSSTITAVAFFGKRVALTASEDGKILVWNCSNWAIQTELLGHKGPVLSLAIHPTGKLALSVGKDKTLRTWNLLKRRLLYVTNVKAVSNVVRYSVDGSNYALGVMEPNARVDVYSTETAGVVSTSETKSKRRVLEIKFAPNGREVAFTADSDLVEFLPIQSPAESGSKKRLEIRRFVAHEPRVKGLDFGVISTPKGVMILLVTCGSEGLVKLWHYSPKHLPTLLTSVNSKCRLTSLITTGACCGDADSSSDESVDEEPPYAAISSRCSSVGKVQRGRVEGDSEEDVGAGKKVEQIDEGPDDFFGGVTGFSRFFLLSRRQRSNLFFHLFAWKRKRLLKKRLKRKLNGL